MKNIVLLFIGVGASYNLEINETYKSICDEIIIKNKTLFEIFLQRIKMLNKIDEIVVLMYDYSDTPMTSELSKKQKEKIEKICMKENIKLFEHKLKFVLTNWSTNWREVNKYVCNLFNSFTQRGDSLIQIYDSNLYFDIDIMNKMIDNHNKNNNSLSEVDDMRFIPNSILNWQNTTRFDKGVEIKLEKLNKYNFQYFRCLYNNEHHLNLIKSLHNYYNSEYISFEQLYDFYKNNKKIFFVYPYHLIVEVTNNCNQQCIFCPQPILKRKKENMPLSLFKKIIDEKSEYPERKLSIEFSGYGEPLLHSDIFLFIDYAKKKLKENCEIDIYTNGEFLDLTAFKNFEKTGLDNIFVSLDAVSKEKYIQIHNADCFEKVISNLNEIVNYKKYNRVIKPRIIPNFVLCNINENEAVEFMKKYGIRQEIIKKLNSSANEIIENELYTGNYLPFDYAIIRGVNDFSGQLNNKKITDYSPSTREYCRQFSTSIYIMSNANVSICRNDIKGNIIIGSIAEQSIKEILTSPNYFEFIDSHQRLNFDGALELCKNCQTWYEIW